MSFYALRLFAEKEGRRQDPFHAASYDYDYSYDYSAFSTNYSAPTYPALLRIGRGAGRTICEHIRWCIAIEAGMAKG